MKAEQASPPLSVLVAEDLEDDYLLVVQQLRRAGLQASCRRVDSAVDMKNALEKERWDVVISDYTMPQFTALDALALLRGSGQSDVPFVILSGSIGEESAVAALKAGASNFLMKSHLDRLVPLIERELRDAAVRREREEAFTALEQAVKVRDEFLSIASHELKTPLTALQLQLECMRETVHKSAQASANTRLETRLQRAVHSTERLGHLVGGLLDVSRISTGRLRLNIEQFDLAGIVREMAERVREEAHAAGSEIEIAADGPIVGCWDRMRIEQVFMNLLSNAIKYGAGKPIEITLSSGPTEAAVRIVDHGIGVSAEDLERIFGRFERAVPSRHYGGLGLGLYITRQIVAAHGGHVSAEATSGGGATFVVDLPLAAKLHVSPDQPAASPPTASSKPQAAPDNELRALIESARDYAIFLVDPHGNIVTWNSGAQRIKQYARDEVIGKHISMFYPPDDVARGKPKRLLDKALAEGRVEDEGWRVRKDGSLFWADVIITPVRDADGGLMGFAKVTRDVTDRKRVEERLAAGAEQQAALARLGLVALNARRVQQVVDVAVELVATTLGAELCSFFQQQLGGSVLSLQAGIGWKHDVVGHTAVPAERGSLLRLVLESTQPVLIDDLRVQQRLTVPTVLRDHGVISSLNVAVPSPDGARPYGALGIHCLQLRQFSADEIQFVQAIANVIATAFARDRTQHELLRAEQTASDERRRAALAQQAIRERDEFITVAAHELRTPVTALQLKLHGISHLANREAGTPSDAQKVKLRLSEALRQMGRLATLVERLIDVSRIVSGRLEVRPSEVDLGVLTSAAVESLQEQARAANVELRLRVSGDTLGAWDRRGVEHVLSSLLANAVKYGRDKPVEVAVEGEEESVRLVIQDRGIGISPEDIQRIFGRFERAAPLRNYAGLGLGLYITRHIVEVHGGTIRVRSEAGKGTRFEIELPKRLPSSQVEDYSAVNL